jgi:DNA-binding transcriptional ArsR family regulator
MSGIALIWAANVKGLQPAAKVVLIQLADFHNKETGRCDPSAKRLAHECEMSRATVFRHLTVLEEIGLITRHGKGDDNGGRSSNQYELHLDVTLGPSSKQGEKSQIETGGKSLTRETGVVSNCDGKSLTRETGVVSNCDTNLTIEPGKNLSPQPPKGGRRGRKENSFGVSESVKQRLREKYNRTGGGNEL